MCIVGCLAASLVLIHLMVVESVHKLWQQNFKILQKCILRCKLLSVENYYFNDTGLFLAFRFLSFLAFLCWSVVRCILKGAFWGCLEFSLCESLLFVLFLFFALWILVSLLFFNLMSLGCFSRFLMFVLQPTNFLRAMNLRTQLTCFLCFRHNYSYKSLLCFQLFKCYEYLNHMYMYIHIHTYIFSIYAFIIFVHMLL